MDYRFKKVTYGMIFDDLATRITAFSAALDMHCKTHDSFFNIDLLNTFEKFFDYHDCSITVYTNDYKFCGGIATSEMQTMTEYYAKNMTAGNDPFSSYITKQCLSTDGIKPLVLISKDAFPENSSEYFHTEYYEYLKKFNFAWVATMTFGNYRFNILKREEDPFLEEEISFLHLISQLFASRLQLFNELKTRYAIGEIKDKLLDANGVGYITLDDDFNLIDYNHTAGAYLSDITDTGNVRYSCTKLLTMMGLTHNISDVESQISMASFSSKGYHINLKTHFETQEYDFIKKYYCITLVKDLSMDMQDSESKQAFSEKYGLSAKEMQVVEKMAEGKTYKEIAASLFISLNTVRTHIKNIYTKVGVNNQRNLLTLYNKATATVHWQLL